MMMERRRPIERQRQNTAFALMTSAGRLGTIKFADFEEIGRPLERQKELAQITAERRREDWQRNAPHLVDGLITIVEV
jgi:hypothetical protein